MMQRKLYYTNKTSRAVMSLPVVAAWSYDLSTNGGWQRCSLKEYRRGLATRRILTEQAQSRGAIIVSGEAAA